jgi:hypothetical protein
MARRIAYIGDPVITLADVARQCRVEPDDLQPELIEQVIIPGVTAQAEQRTGAAIRAAEYEEDWAEGRATGAALDVGQAGEVVSVHRVLADGSTELLTAPLYLQRGQRESFLHFPQGRPVGVLRVRYKAGFDPDAYPGVRSWLLMNAATAYEFRETLVVGTILAELPSHFTDSLLAEIEVPPRF